MSTLIILVAAFLCVTALVAAIGFWVMGSDESEVEDRLAMLTGSTSSKQANEALLKGSVLARPLESSQHMLWTTLARMGNLNLLFEQADTTMTAPQFFGIAAAMSVVGMCIPFAAGMHPSIIVPMGISLAFLPLMWLIMRRRSRFKKFAKQLPDALELISRALRAGHSLGSGINLVAEEMRRRRHHD